MDTLTDTMTLSDSAAYAYERFRVEVLDRLPAGTPIDMSNLSRYQQDVLIDLLETELAVDAERERQYASDVLAAWRHERRTGRRRESDRRIH